MQTKTKIAESTHPTRRGNDKVSTTAIVVCDFPNGLGCGICEACQKARRVNDLDVNSAAALMREVAKTAGPKVHTKRYLWGVFVTKINSILPARGYTWTVFDSRHRRSTKGLSAMPIPKKPDEPYRISFEITKIDRSASSRHQQK